MVSNICKIENGTADLKAILQESERVGNYNGLTQKETLQLRLICEEIDGMLPNVIGEFNGDFWIEFEDDVCKVNACIDIPELNTTKKEELISLAKNKKNAAAVGIVGKIRNVIENLFLTEQATIVYDSDNSFYMTKGYHNQIDFSCIWSLNNYKTTCEKADEDGWDELEKSIIANLADDVIVGVKGKKANIVVVKKFR